MLAVSDEEKVSVDTPLKINIEKTLSSTNDITHEYITKHKLKFEEILNNYPTIPIDKNIKSHPHDTANCIGEYTQCYMRKLMVLGKHKILQLTDLSSPPKITQLNYVYNKFVNTYIPKELSDNYNPKEFHFTFNVFLTLIQFNKWYIKKQYKKERL